jgi:hypothetical protein
MATPKPTRSKSEYVAETVQNQILAQLTALGGKVDEAIEQGKENAYQMKLLRSELGLDGTHGRLPLFEAQLAKLELSIQKQEARINELEAEKLEAEGRHKLLSTVTALCGGGAGGAAITLIGRLLRSGF